MDYQIVRSSRKTICIQLSRDGNVIVRAPRHCPKWYIENFVNSKTDWILTHQAALLERNALRDAFFLRDGDTFSFCGDTVTVQICPGAKSALAGGALTLPDGNVEQNRGDILRLVSEQSLGWLRQRLDAWAARMGIQYQMLKLSNARTRWGSCSRKGVIRISVWLLFAPLDCIDYVLVHELAHRRHFDHSRDFWAEVAAVMPDYGRRRAALRRFQNDPLLQALAKKE